MKKRVLTLVLVISILFQMIPMGSLVFASGETGLHQTQVPVGYTGIYTAADLNNVRNNLSGKYIMMNEIDLVATISPIGTGASNYFSGIFDGNGYTIKGLNTYAAGSTLYAGLFGYNKGTIENVGLINGSVSANASGYVFMPYANTYVYLYAGSIAGYNAGTINNCYNTGSVSATASVTSQPNQNPSPSASIYAYTYAGGIAGYSTGTINNSYNTGSLSATATAKSYPPPGTLRGASPAFSYTYAGGITGYNNGTMSCCYNTENVDVAASACTIEGASEDWTYAGGIAGYSDSSGIISNCYNTGYVNENSIENPYAGGIAGYNLGAVSNCYNIGNATSAIIGSTNYNPTFCIGGIEGNNGGTNTNCYYLNVISRGVGNGTDSTIKCTFEQMEQQLTFTGFDFSGTWSMSNALGYPFPTLQNLQFAQRGENTTDFMGGNGTVYNPYRISTKVQLNSVRNYPYACFILNNDIVFNESDFTQGGAFYESDEGNIEGWIPIAPYDNSNTSVVPFAGVFNGNGYTISGLVMNVYLDASDDAGLFDMVNGTIENLGMKDCSIEAYGYLSPIEGAIVGRNDGSIMNCYTDGNTTVTSQTFLVGGIAGYNDKFGIISNCYNTAAVTSGADRAGGIVGVNDGGTISNCYNTGSVTGSFTGGIASANYGTISNCYYLNNITQGVGSGANTTVKCTLDQMKLQSTYVGFDFNTIWQMPDMNLPIFKPITYMNFKCQNGNLTGIDPSTKSVFVKNNMVTDQGETTKILNMNNVEISDNDTVGTGMKVQIVLGSNVVNTYDVVIYGDVNGDGNINLNDLADIRDSILGVSSLTNDFKTAGDLYCEGNITLNDLVGVMSYLSETSSISQNR